MPELITVEDALARVLETASPGPTAFVPLDEAAGHVLGQAVEADRPYPPFDRSRVDGYAVRCEDCSADPLDVVCEVAAGKEPPGAIGPGEAARVFTGAAVPDGADAVVMQEDCIAETDAEGRRRVIVEKAPARGQFITALGAERGHGETVAAIGDLLTPARVGALASVGANYVAARIPPQVRIVATGSELVSIGQSPARTQIRNSNAHALSAAARSAGAQVETMEMVEDTQEAHLAALKRALGGDVVIVTGGVSVGDYDLVPHSLVRLGVRRVFHGVKLQPGKPLWFGVKERTLVFGLPGNPVSSLVNFTLFVRPAIRCFLGLEPASEPPAKATLSAPLGPGTWRTRFVPVRTQSRPDGAMAVEPISFRGSGDVFGFCGADALAIVPIDAPPREAGDTVDVVPLGTP